MPRPFFCQSRASRRFRFARVPAICITALFYAASALAQETPRERKQAPQSSPQSPQLSSQGGQASPPGGQASPQAGTNQPAFSPEQIQAGQALFAGQCGFCHGRDAGGGEGGPDLTASSVVAQDVRGERIGQVVRNGRPDKGMPAFAPTDEQLAALVAFIHDRKARAKEGRRRTVDVTDLQTGNVEAGKRYFNGPGGCVKCHSPSGDLAGIAGKFQGLELLRRMLYDEDRRSTQPTPTTPSATITLPSGQAVTGKLAYRDEFTIAVIDASGSYRSWPTSQVKFTVVNPLEAHIELLGKYSDEDIHNVLAYLQTLR
jgi:cytochrome c oxidase cbb3-type subunit III